MKYNWDNIHLSCVSYTILKCQKAKTDFYSIGTIYLRKNEPNRCLIIRQNGFLTVDIKIVSISCTF